AVVRNSGGRQGSEVLQVYVHRAGSARPARLMAFRRVEVPAGGAATVELTVARSTLAERDTGSHAMVVRPGTYEVRVARHAVDEGTPVAVAIN
ncbi:MAG: fibronectin type III-like domain-contianing protein, partial [Acidimicrobiales bacterium]